jgi:hypothetical protein
MSLREIEINDKIHIIHDNLESIKQLYRRSLTCTNVGEILRQVIQLHRDNKDLTQELLHDGIDQQEMDARLQEVEALARHDHSPTDEQVPSFCFPSRFPTAAAAPSYARQRITFVPPQDGPLFEHDSMMTTKNHRHPQEEGERASHGDYRDDSDIGTTTPSSRR